MPNFDCECNKCKEILEFRGVRHEDLPKKHQGCGGLLSRLWNFSTKVKSTIQTVGSLADKNASKMSDDEKAFRKEQQKTKKDSDLPGYNTKHPLWNQMKDYRP